MEAASMNNDTTNNLVTNSDTADSPAFADSRMVGGEQQEGQTSSPGNDVLESDGILDSEEDSYLPEGGEEVDEDLCYDDDDNILLSDDEDDSILDE